MSNKQPKIHNGNRHRGPTPHMKSCGFCGKSQNDVPLLLKSTITNHTICGFCAMAITSKTMEHMTDVSAAYKQIVMSKPEWFDRDPETGAITMINPEKAMDDALNEVENVQEPPDGVQ